MLKQLEIHDYDAVYQLWKETDGMGLRSLDDSREGIERFLKRNPTSNFLYLEDGRTVGAILSGHDGRRGYIYHAVVHTEYRKRGIGKRLVDAALDALKKEDIHKVALVVFSDNEKGNQFWASIGFGKRDDLLYRNRSLNELNT